MQSKFLAVFVGTLIAIAAMPLLSRVLPPAQS